MAITFTDHALDALNERRIDKRWIEAVIQSPDALEPDPAHGDRIRAWKAIPERDGRMLRVVYIPDGDDVRVLTAFFDRGRRR